MNHMNKFLTKKIKARCPYEVAKENNILIINEPLGNIDGYYNKINGQKFIHVNSDASDWSKEYIIAHELYFALLDVEYKFLILGETTSHKEANDFAIMLLHKGCNKRRHDYQLIMA